MTTLRAVGQTYNDHSAVDRSGLLYDAAAIIERTGYSPTPEEGITIIGAISKASQVYSDPSAAFRDAMFLVNSRFLIEQGTFTRERDVAWVKWTRTLDTESACHFLRTTARLVSDPS